MSNRLPPLDSTPPTPEPAPAVAAVAPTHPDTVRPLIAWLQAHAAEHSLTQQALGKALDYHPSTISRILDGTYAGSWDQVAAAISRYQQIVQDSGTIQRGEFSPNRISRAIAAGLRYAVANKSIVTIIGESGTGKTAGVAHWRTTQFRGTCHRVIAPPSGKHAAFIRRLCDAIGHPDSMSVQRGEAALTKYFTRDMLLIIDHAHRLLPAGRSDTPTSIEFLIDLLDETQCPIVLISTQRFLTQLHALRYQCEQFTRRIGMPISLPGRVRPTDISGIIRQYIASPSDKFLDVCTEIANGPGRIGILCETLRIASRMAAKQQAQRITQEHVLAAHAIRQKMMTGTLDDEPATAPTSVSSVPSVPAPRR